MATNMTYKERLLLVKTALKLLSINSRILPQWFSLHGTMMEIYIASLSREKRAQHGFLRLVTSSV